MQVMDTEARTDMCREIPRPASSSTRRRRYRCRKPKVCSTFQRRGSTWKPLRPGVPAGMQEGGRILTGKAAVQPDEEERRVRLQIRAEGVQGVAILRVSRYHPHAERIALRVDHEHPLPAP
jgi:hypothetical protein